MPVQSMHGEDHIVVAIGASAGGLEAIHEFFDNMPESSNISYVIIQHLSPDHKSLLVDLVSRHTNMKVYEAAHNLPVYKNCVYVIPNNKFITIKGNKLILTEKLAANIPNNAIDVFLHSLAKEKRQAAIAVILSGTGTDGTKGIQSIKDEGGLVMVQEPGSAKFDGMPNSAIASGNADYILSPSEIPKEIINYLCESDREEDDQIDESVLQEIFGLIHTHAGFDFHYYKTPTITRRIWNRISRLNLKTAEAYVDYIRKTPDESKQLGKDFLINVTKFFRDPEAFEVLRTKVIPEIVDNKEEGSTFKLWIAACSTGEEAYSLAILVDQVLKTMRRNLMVKIFASDIERSNIDIASKGFYPNSIVHDIDHNTLEEYFVDQGNGYLVTPRIRKQIVFTQHNIIKDPPFIKNDLVSCRNMLIYMNNILQQRVYSVLLFSVTRNGYLFLGTSESAAPLKNHVTELDGRWKIYKKVSDTKPTPYLLDTPRVSSDEGYKFSRTVPAESKRKKGLWDDFKETLFNEFNLAAFYIDRNFEIKEAIGNFDKILSLPRKILKLNLLRMLPGNVASALIGEIKTAWKNNEKRIVKNLHFKQENTDVALQVLIRADQQGSNAYTLVAFHFMQIEDPLITNGPRIVYPDINQNDYVISLEEELSETKANLQYAVEDLETANEELQSSNEELLSANEELQSSNEELQSLNEELHTLNTEHQLKIKELIELNDDLNNYYRSSNIGQVFLDKNLAIRKFNPPAVQIINFIDGDIGRPIAHISTNIKYDGFLTDIENVLKKGLVVEREVQLVTGKNLLLRIMPYIAQDRKNSGVVISFIDITAITNLNNIIRGVFNSSLSSIFALEAVRDHTNKISDLTILEYNYAAATLMSIEHNTVKGKSFKHALPQSIVNKPYPQFLQVIETGYPLHIDHYDESEKRWFEIIAVKMMDGIVATFTDITQKKVADERLKKNYVELIATKENLKKLNAELERKVMERTKLLSESEERFRMVSRATNDAIWDWDFINNKMWFSDAFYSKFGYNHITLFSRREWLEKVHPDDRRNVDKSIFNTINSGAKQWSEEYRFQKENGAYAHILDRGYVLQDEYHTPYRMIGSMLDLTELKNAEREVASNIEERKFMIESMPLIVWTATAECDVDFVNRQFEVYTGISHDEALHGGWQISVHPDDLQNLLLRWNIASANRDDFQMEIRMKLYDGSYHWNLFRAKARKNTDNDLSGWIITTIDIHEQKVINETLEQKVEERTQELVKMNAALEMSNHDLQQFASVASHDLQEPLRKIHMFAKMIQDRYSDQLDGAANYLQKIMHSSVRMKSIITNILNFSKLSADHTSFEPTDINEVIREILNDFEILIEDKKAVVHVDQFPEMYTIPGQIQQVFQNIIGNALKFSKQDEPPVINISVNRINRRALDAPNDENGDFCRIVITDNGIGFDHKFAQNVFVLFQRLHSKDKYDGTGIGLAIVKKIIEKHKGLVAAEGKEGQGATFTLILPIAPQHIN